MNASLVIVATVGADLEGIRKALEKALTDIVAQTTGAVGGILNAIQGFTQAQVDTLAASLIALQKLINGISITLTVEATNLAPS